MLEIEPFFDLGYKSHSLEIIAFLAFGIPTQLDEGEEVENDLASNLSALYHFGPRFSWLLELDAETALNGEEEGKSGVNLTPGIKFAPIGDLRLLVGLGVSFPVSEETEFDSRVIASAFYHF